MAAPNDSRSDYMLATGSEAEHRLRLLDEIFGPGTRELLHQVGLAPGMRVAEIGCGTGLVALWMAGQVAARGSVAAVDMSSEQLAVAERNAAVAGLKNISFRAAGA
ncbi:MAG TPA: methyltransferase domain-containing protein [Terriglobales bacterium]|nr:methyltransferase domain-containing protein [Terriglobales bacterium]